MPSQFRTALCRAFLFATPMLVCAPGFVEAQAGRTLDQVIEWRDTVNLEETDSVINVVYNVTADIGGTFLVSDEREGQFRRYSRTGSLLWAFGRKGDGPAEFRAPVRALRLRNPAGRIVLLDRQGKIAVYDEEGDSLVSTARLNLLRVADLALADASDEAWVATGINDPSHPAMLHLVNVYTGEQLAHMFAPTEPGDPSREALYMNWSGVARSTAGDTLWGVMATQDTLYGLSARSREVVRRMPLASGALRPLTLASAADWSDSQGRRKWAEKQSYLTDVFPLTGGKMAVLFEDFRNGLPAWGFMLLDNDRVVFDATDTHRLLTVFPESGLLVFQDHNYLEGNRWLVGQLRK